MAEYCINAKATGVLRHTHYMEHWAAHPDVIFTSYLVPVGADLCVGSLMRCSYYRMHCFSTAAHS
jgi:hypothetical protein